ncbi:uncharacterized protein LACBIDRAFT_328131 [Laccaria bicolor S238N-H82]|uniref:Predicted protein n=1 Tax=Laccaria bicolor (strain S238N-H82 / ATCC MYA-4686) TaxID=486041 RepID=B0DDV0_LACBS|nr:uncharacterized protein LACBIDRAFT_328131 [Laccaria bicolor S238N-H82]EDR07281.1 predicted protein [Laccaria bicolor S238N-H82]|eukprot:XP_001882212.1 predicted protein [Laccaria bicolor S238N-H82]
MLRGGCGHPYQVVFSLSHFTEVLSASEPSYHNIDRNPVGEDVLQENHNHPKPKCLFRRLTFKRSRVLVGTPQLGERIPSTVILNDQTSVIPLSETHRGHSPPITLGEDTIAGPSTLQPPLKRTESGEDGDECESVYYTPPGMGDSVSLHSSNANGSVEEAVLALGHGHDHADEEVIASPADIYSLIDRGPLGSSLADIENNNDARTSRTPLTIPQLPIGPISETSSGSASSASPSSDPEQSPQRRQLTVFRRCTLASYDGDMLSITTCVSEVEGPHRLSGPHPFFCNASVAVVLNSTTIPMSFATPNLRYLSWTFNLPLSAPIPPQFEFPWFALRHVQHGLTWSLLTIVELDCPLTIEDCLFVLSEGQDNLECVSFRTVDGLGVKWTSTITLLRLDSLSVEGIGDLGPLFSVLRMERHRHLGMTSHTRGAEVCAATPSPHALNVRWSSLTHVDLFCHLTKFDLVRLMCGLCNVVSFQWRGHLTPGASIPGAMGAVHMLNHLTEVIVYSNQSGCETILDILTESHGVSLRKIIIDKPVMHFSASLIPIPGEWALRSRKLDEMKAALYSITLNDVEHPISISDAWAILSQCRQLKELDVHVAGRVPPNSGLLLAGVELSSGLQILKLDLDVPVSILFRNLRLPNLATLEMTFSDSNHIHAKGLDAALERWGCPLTCVLLRNSNIGEGTLIKCLTSVSSTLKDLLIYGAGPLSGCTMGKLALQRLILQEGLKHDLCPKLESLTLEPCVAPDGALAQLLYSKAPPLRCCGGVGCNLCIEKIVPLRRVRVSFLKVVVPNMTEVREEDFKMIGRLKETGMNIEIVD